MEAQVFTTLAEKVDPRHAALIVVDVQNDWCAPGGNAAKRGLDLYLSNTQAMMPRLLSLIEEARKVSCPIIFVQNLRGNPYDSPVSLERNMRRERSGEKGTELPLCIPGTWGADFYQVKPLPGEAVVQKHRPSAFVNTDLDLILRSQGIKTVILTGVVSHVCVESTARDAFMLDYYTVFVEDCTAGREEHLHQACLENIDAYFGEVCSAKDVAGAWAQVRTRQEAR